MAAASAPGSPGGTSRPVSRWRPTTSGRAPPVVLTRATPQAMASTAGSEKPSYSDGTTATSADAYSSTMRRASTAPATVTAPSSPSRSMVAGTRPPSRGGPTMTSSAWRSVRTLASASSRGTRPLRATSALAVVISRPGTLATWGRGRNQSVSTPTGTTDIWPGRAPICRQMSPADDSDTVSRRGSRRSTRFCIRTKPYQRRRLIRRCQSAAWASSRSRSTVIGWWIVATTGRPSRAMPRMP